MRKLFWFIFVFFVVFCVLFLSSSILLALKTNEETEKKPENTKQFLSVSSDGSITISEVKADLDEEFNFFESEDGDINLISELGSSEFICTGNCYTSPSDITKDNRKLSSKILGSSMTYLLAAVSTAIAFSAAKKHFHEKCIKEYEGLYSESNIESEVEECDYVFPEGYVRDGTEKPAPYDKDTKLKKYDCQGSCVPIKNPESDFDCSKLTKRAEISVPDVKIPKTVYDYARIRFVTHHLMVYCWENSQFEKSYEFDNKNGETEKSVFKTGHCFGGDPALNPTVKCVKI